MRRARADKVMKMRRITFPYRRSRLSSELSLVPLDCVDLVGEQLAGLKRRASRVVAHGRVRALVRELAAFAAPRRRDLHLANLVDPQAVRVAVLVPERVLGAGADVEEGALGCLGLALALARGVQRRVHQEDRVARARRHAQEEQQRLVLAGQHVEPLETLDVARAAVRDERHVHDVAVLDGLGRRGAAAGAAGRAGVAAAGRAGVAGARGAATGVPGWTLRSCCPRRSRARSWRPPVLRDASSAG